MLQAVLCYNISRHVLLSLKSNIRGDNYLVKYVVMQLNEWNGNRSLSDGLMNDLQG